MIQKKAFFTVHAKNVSKHMRKKYSTGARFTKKILLCFIAITLTCLFLPGCSDSKDTSSHTPENDTLKIVSTIYPQHDWVQQVLGDEAAGAELTLLVNQGVDLHSYQPTVKDIATLSNCDLFIYVGGESDAWVEDALANAANKNMVVVKLTDILSSSLKTEEKKEGMEGYAADQEECKTEGIGESEAKAESERETKAESERETEVESMAESKPKLDLHEGDDIEAESKHEHDLHEEETDEHVWLSLRNADIICAYLAEQLSQLDPANASTYRTNYRTYSEKLSSLDAKYLSALGNATYSTLIFGDRFPFRYLLDDYNINYFAAFPGCSSETEASFETILFLSQKLDELKLPGIMVTESSDLSIAKTIIKSTTKQDQKIFVLDSLQSTGDLSGETSYLAIMENNLQVLEEALN